MSFGSALMQTKMYSAEATAVVSTGINENIGLAFSADNLAKSKAKQYQTLANSRNVAESALRKANLIGSAEAQLGRVSVAVPLDTAQIKISVTRDKPDEARNLADAWIVALAENVDKVENQKVDDSEITPNLGEASRVSVIKILPLAQAVQPTSPSSPKPQLYAAFGGLTGLLLGLGLVALSAFFDRRIRSAKTLEEDFGLSVVGTIPLSESIGSSRVLDRFSATSRRTSNKDFRITEAFKELRTNLQFMKPDKPPRIIVVTSCTPGDGKSTVAANIAQTLAESGEMVVLVDCDLRRPTVARTFDLVDGVGLTDVIVGRASLDDVLQLTDAEERLMVLGSGPTPPNPIEILASDRLGEVFQELSEHRILIVDAPPLLPVTDAAILAARFDGALMVVNAGQTTKEELAKAVDSLTKVHGEILGVVLNRVPTSKSESGHYRYYGSSYSYGSQNGARKPKTRSRKLSRAEKIGA